MKKVLHKVPMIVIGVVTFIAFAACDSANLFPGVDSNTSVAQEPSSARASSSRTVRANVLLNTAVTDEIRAEIEQIGRITDEFSSIAAVVVQGKGSIVSDLQALPFVEAVNPDAERYAPPVASEAVEDELFYGISTWDLDAVNVADTIWAYPTDPDTGDPLPPYPVATGRVEAYSGAGVYVAVLDTGLVNDWPQYFPAERIASEYAIAFGGGGGEMGAVSSQPNKWEHDTDSHGTHVASTILGYSFYGTPVNGVAPDATVIPVKVLNQNGSGWSSVVARGIEYVGELKAGRLADYPVVINMSLGGPELDAVEKAAIDFAIEQGVLIVASAGNEGEAGMGYPGAYGPVISVAASGWVDEWRAPGWPFQPDVPEGTDPLDYYITDFSSRAYGDQDLDVAAPGSWVVGPYQVNSGQISYYYLGGTSMASPHVAGIVALMAQMNPSLSASVAEQILEEAAIPFEAGDKVRNIGSPYGDQVVAFGDNSTGAGLVTADAALAGVATTLP